MVKSAYIHIPFCKSKCHYCSFVSFTNLEFKKGYLDALKKEIKETYKGETLDTVYFGGGTPSLLSVDEIEDLFNQFNISHNAEITLELNPETVDDEYLSALSKTLVNRLSIGVQSFDDEILKNIGRRHNSADVFRVIKSLRRVGFENFSVDFIYGLPDQSLKSFVSDLKTAINLKVPHISLYGLKIDEGCFFAVQPPKNIANEDLQAKMYLEAIKTLTVEGYEHYEISNFAHVNKISCHNNNYWENQEYYGFGVASHAYINGMRYSHSSILEKYLKNPTEKEFVQDLTHDEKLEEEIFLGFRLLKGLDVQKINVKFGIDFDSKYENILKKYLSSKHLLKTENGYKLSDKGILVSNVILSEFL